MVLDFVSFVVNYNNPDWPRNILVTVVHSKYIFLMEILFNFKIVICFLLQVN